MATHYVRKTGSNSNNGSSPSTAWLTLTYALGSGALSAGDTVYVGAGVYAEQPTMSYSGSSGNVISIIGDVTGQYTGDAGEVQVTSWLSGNTGAVTGNYGLTLGATAYTSWSFITFIAVIAGFINAGCVQANASTSGAGNVTFSDCTFIGYQGITWTGNTTGLASSLTIDRCSFLCYEWCIEIILPTTTSGSADYDALIVVRNSLLINVAADYGIYVSATGTSTHAGGGVRAYSCTFLASIGMETVTASHLSTTVPCACYDSVLVGQNGMTAATSGQLVENYNVFYCLTPRSSVTTGANSQTGYAPVLEIGQSFKYGGINRPFLSLPVGSPVLGFGSNGTGGNYPTVDWQNRPRPSGGGSSSYAAGYLERHDFAIQNTTTVQGSSTSSGELVGPGDQYILVPVDAVSSTISIWLYQGSGYGGTTYAAAVLLANGELGIATQTQTCSSTLGAWQQLTFSAVTASKSGWVTLQIVSYDTSGTGTLFFDNLAVA